MAIITLVEDEVVKRKKKKSKSKKPAVATHGSASPKTDTKADKEELDYGEVDG